MQLFLLMLIGVVVLLSSEVSAQIYRHQGPDGKLYLTNASDTLRVEILHSAYTAERGIDGVVIVWVTGRVKHTLPRSVMIKLETTVYDHAGRFLGAYAFYIADPVPPNTPRGFRNVALGHNLPAGTVVGKVDIEVIRVSQVSN